MNHEELKDLLPLYALGGLDAESAAEVERHIAEPCPECAAELREWHEVAGVLPLGVAPAGPDAAMKERLMAQVRHDVPVEAAPSSVREWWSWQMAAPLATAALVLLVLAGVWYRALQRGGTAEIARIEALTTQRDQQQEKLAEHRREIQGLRARLEEQEGTVMTRVTDLQAALTHQRQLATQREQELEQLQAVNAQAEGEVATLTARRAQLREDITGREGEVHVLRTTLEAQRAVLEKNGHEIDLLRAGLARQRMVIEVLAAPGVRVSYLQQVKQGAQTRGHIVWNEHKKTWLFYAFGMPTPPAGKAYQVWFITEKGGPVSAGLFMPDQSGTGWVMATSPAQRLGSVSAAAVSLEAAGGLPTLSGDIYLRGSL
jgi:anti-sigma-K factor RskA